MNMSLTTIPLVTKLSKNVIRILGCNPGPMTLQGTNTYLLGTGKRRILVDSGGEETAPVYTKILAEVLQRENAEIEHLVITHWHYDHTGGAASVRDLVKSMTESQLTTWKLPRIIRTRKPDEPEILSEPGIDKCISWSTVPCNTLNDEQSLQVEGANIRIKYTPGHSTDHACIMLENDNILFSGDCILGEGTTVIEDLQDYMQTLEKIMRMKPKLIYPGHGPVVQDPEKTIKFYIEHRNKREAQIMQVLDTIEPVKPLTAYDLVEAIYKDTPQNLWPAAANNVNLHLAKLQKDGKVKQVKFADHSGFVSNKISKEKCRL